MRPRPGMGAGPGGPPAMSGGRPPMGGKPPMGGGMKPPSIPPAAQNPIDENRSVLNPTDVGYMKSAMGNQEPSIEDLVTNILRVPGGTQAPMSALIAALKKQSENTSMQGKMKNMAMGGQKPPMPSPAGRRPAPGPGANAPAPKPAGGMPPRQAGPPAELSGLLNSLGNRGGQR